MIPETESGDMLTRELLRVVLEEDGNDETDISNPSKGSCCFLVVVCVRCCCCCFCRASSVWERLALDMDCIGVVVVMVCLLVVSDPLDDADVVPDRGGDRCDMDRLRMPVEDCLCG